MLRMWKATVLTLFPRVAAALEKEGISALEVGRDYDGADFYEWIHLSEKGGRKMAEDVAPRIKKLAHELGYFGNGVVP